MHVYLNLLRKKMKSHSSDVKDLNNMSHCYEILLCRGKIPLSSKPNNPHKYPMMFKFPFP